MSNLDVAVLTINHSDANLLHHPLHYGTQVNLSRTLIVFPVIYVRNVPFGYQDVLIDALIIPLPTAYIPLKKVTQGGFLTLAYRIIPVTKTRAGSTNGLNKVVNYYIIFHIGIIKSVSPALPKYNIRVPARA